MIKICGMYLSILFLAGLFLVGCCDEPHVYKFRIGQSVVVKGLNVKGVVHSQWGDTVNILYTDNNGQIQSQNVTANELQPVELEAK